MKEIHAPTPTTLKSARRTVPSPGREAMNISGAAGTDRHVDAVMAGPGGVMTDQVGVITGDLTVRTVLGADRHTAHVTVQYTGAEEWYTLTGSPAPVPDEDLTAYHQNLLDRIRDGGATEAT
ncbi:hypothetical protein [Streptomyces broussonetiae]|nr:hypothetical protein [Streptomyces broussonetiae]